MQYLACAEPLRRAGLSAAAETLATARRYASPAYAVVVCPFVCLSVRLSHAGIVSKRLNVESRKQHCTIVQKLWFSGANNLGEIPTGSPQQLITLTVDICVQHGGPEALHRAGLSAAAETSCIVKCVNSI